jgi:hypothetical protein
MGDSMSTIINATTTNGVVIQPDNSGSLVLQTNNGTTALTIDTSQRAAFVAGTAALPAITTTGDTNTGMWFPAADTIAFSEGGAEAMRLDSSGNVGIGTTSPTATLNISTASSNATLLQEVARLSTTGRSGAGGTASRGTLLSFSDASNFTLTSAVGGIRQNSDADFNGALAFYTSGTGASQATSVSQLTERMRIDSSGRVLIGTASSLASEKLGISFDGLTANAVVLQTTYASTGSAYTLFKNSAGANAGSITQNGTTTVAYTTSSDYRLKENIAPMTGALATIQALKPVTYKWKIDGSDGQGFIAHELAEIVPDCVVGEKDAVDTEGNPKYQGVDTSFLVATLTAAIQEQQTIINDLKARVETLEAK